jgi:hypothetical protein
MTLDTEAVAQRRSQVIERRQRVQCALMPTFVRRTWKQVSLVI